MTLKVYADRMSEPSRAVLIFCKVNKIDFEEINVDLAKRQHLSPGFEEVNPMRQVPVIVDGRLKLSESHAILRYLACASPGVADHWYPTDLLKRAKVDSVLDWHHTTLRHGAATLVRNTVLAPAIGLQPNPHIGAEAEKILSASLEKIETIWLEGNGQFLVGSDQPSIADISLVCQIMQLEKDILHVKVIDSITRTSFGWPVGGQFLDEKDRDRILSPHKKVQQWVEDVKQATKPHFEEVHGELFKAKAKLQEQRLLGAKN